MNNRSVIESGSGEMLSNVISHSPAVARFGGYLHRINGIDTVCGWN